VGLEVVLVKKMGIEIMIEGRQSGLLLSPSVVVAKD